VKEIFQLSFIAFCDNKIIFFCNAIIIKCNFKKPESASLCEIDFVRNMLIKRHQGLNNFEYIRMR